MTTLTPTQVDLLSQLLDALTVVAAHTPQAPDWPTLRADVLVGGLPSQVGLMLQGQYSPMVPPPQDPRDALSRAEELTRRSEFLSVPGAVVLRDKLVDAWGDLRHARYAS